MNYLPEIYQKTHSLLLISIYDFSNIENNDKLILIIKKIIEHIKLLSIYKIPIQDFLSSFCYFMLDFYLVILKISKILKLFGKNYFKHSKNKFKHYFVLKTSKTTENLFDNFSTSFDDSNKLKQFIEEYQEKLEKQEKLIKNQDLKKLKQRIQKEQEIRMKDQKRTRSKLIPIFPRFPKQDELKNWKIIFKEMMKKKLNKTKDRKMIQVMRVSEFIIYKSRLLLSQTKCILYKIDTEKWRNGMITNYKYLMQINTLLGRSYNDLSQYFIFPIIFKNYNSLEIDLNNRQKIKQYNPEFYSFPKFLDSKSNFQHGKAIYQIQRIENQVAFAQFQQTIFPQNLNIIYKWNYSDQTLRTYDIKEKKTVFIQEQIHNDKITSLAICGDIIVTGGGDCCVNVWKFEHQSKPLILLSRLTGHTKKITSLAISKAHSIIVSGSKDLTCHIWDLKRLRYIRYLYELQHHPEFIQINEISGEIVVCSFSRIVVWNLNGNLIGKSKPMDNLSQKITSLGMSNKSQFCDEHVYLTGHYDGVVRFWKPTYNNNNFNNNFIQNDTNQTMSVFWELVCSDSPITAFISFKSNKYLYTGNSKGKIIEWSLPDKKYEQKVFDFQSFKNCSICGIEFNSQVLKHQCKSCQKAVCAKCSNHKQELIDLNIFTKS
ncbi:beach domain-containing protein [Anaeramoeba ignava]|uniref:Beach domain-containing protein n=1 Tax=Anaeramoeba ignava TaxID=1746090 RepID=A0A9Q0R7G4_ANAIG|nr:beach domain-containing protein [Anaeramoeba ignava]